MAKGWKRRFDEPIPLPRSRQLVTLEDAGNYIATLPNAVHEAEEWQAAMEALMIVVTLGGPGYVCTHRQYEGDQSARRAGVRPIAQKKRSIGGAESWRGISKLVVHSRKVFAR